MIILLIAPNGFVGKHLRQRLICDGHHVIGADRQFAYIPEIQDESYDVIINAAGEIGASHKMYESNVALVERVLRFARDAGVKRVVHIGSSSEYGAITEPRREDMLCVPTDLYSASKIAATALCQGFAKQHDMDVVVARPFSLYGPGDKPRKLIPRLLAATRGGDMVKVNGHAKHDWLHIDDFVDGLLTLMHAPKMWTQGDVVNFGTGRASSNRDIVDILHCHDKVEWVEQPQSGSCIGAVNWVADTTKARKRYGWIAKISLSDGLLKTYESTSS